MYTWCSSLISLDFSSIPVPFLRIPSTLPCPGYSIWNAWNGGWTAEIPGGFHGMGDGFHSFSIWIPYFFHMDSMTSLMDSMDFPHGFHDFPDGFHGLSWWIPYFWWVDSMDFPYGMSSWNHNSTLILHCLQSGIHMEWLCGINILHLKLSVVVLIDIVQKFELLSTKIIHHYHYHHHHHFSHPLPTDY